MSSKENIIMLEYFKYIIYKFLNVNHESLFLIIKCIDMI